MPELDDLLDVARGADRAAADAADLPDYAGVARRGHALRSRRRFAAVGAAAVAVLVVVGVAQLAGPGPTGGPEPAPAPASPTAPVTPSTDAPPPSTNASPSTWNAADAEEIINAPAAEIYRVAADPVDADRRAIVWGFGSEGSVIATTTDGFDTRTLHKFEDLVSVAALGDGRFAVVSIESSVVVLLRADGSMTQIEVDMTESPVGSGEVVVATKGPPSSAVAVAIDGTAETAHRISIPDVMVWDILAFGGRLQIIEYRDDPDLDESQRLREAIIYHWSDDGGATWDKVEVDSNWWSFVVPTAAGQDHLLIESGDGATLNPFLGLHGMHHAGGVFVETELDRDDRMPMGRAYVWEGELRVFRSAWDFDDPESAGPHAFSDGDLTKLETNLAELPTTPTYALVGIDHRDSGPGPVLWASGQGNRLYRSTDGGETWEEHEAR